MAGYQNRHTASRRRSTEEDSTARIHDTHTHVQRLWDRLAYSSASVGLFLGAVVFAGGLFGAAAGFSSGLSLGVVEFAAVKKVTALRSYLPAAFKEEEDDEDATADGAAGAAAAKKAD